MDSQAMVDYIKNFQLDRCLYGNQGYSRVLLQLFGYTGHGKSSLINSCKYVLDDQPYQMYAKVAGSNKGPETMIRKAHMLTDTVTLVDNRGCVKMNKDETGAIYAQLGNFLPLDTGVKWQSNFNDMLNILLDAEERDQSADLIVPVLIYSARKLIAPEEVNELREILLKARNITGLFPTVVLTHKLSEHLPDTQEKFRMMGVENMWPVENYTEQDNLKTREKHEGILRCLYETIKDAESRMRERRDPINEKKERKRILYEFAHKRDMEKVQDQERREFVRREGVGNVMPVLPSLFHTSRKLVPGRQLCSSSSRRSLFESPFISPTVASLPCLPASAAAPPPRLPACVPNRAEMNRLSAEIREILSRKNI